MRRTPLSPVCAPLFWAAALSGCSSKDIGFQTLERPPAVTINSPEDGATATEADAIDFVGMVADPDGLDHLVTLEWASDIDGVLADLDSAPPDGDGITQFAHSLSVGTHAISLTAIDDTDLKTVASVSISIGLSDYLPEAEISVPSSFERYLPGEAINLVGAASDPNQSPETLQATWQFAPESGSPRTTIATMAPSSAGSVIGLWEDAEIGIYQIILTIEDSEGNTGEASVSIEITDPNANDADLDGFPAGNDCDDTDAAMFPGNPEICDLKDNDCNGVVDDKDIDNDDHIDINCVEYPGALPIDDCDDTDGTVFPDAAEQADGLDNDCDGVIDDGLSNFDNDGDCFCTAIDCVGSINEDCLVLATGDCDDTNAALHARDDDLDGASPCDGDCNDLDSLLNVDDLDGDTFSTCQNDCDDNNAVLSPADIDTDGASACAGDCDDLDALLNILDADLDGASSCAGDCNDGSAILNVRDDDGDTFTTCAGDCDDSLPTLTPYDGDLDGASTCAGDCNDSDPLLNVLDEDLDTFTTCQNDCDDLDDTLTPADIDVDGFSTCQNDCDDLVASLTPADLDGDLASTCAGDCDDSSNALNIQDVDGDGGTTCAGDCNDNDTALNIDDLDADGFTTCENDCNDNNANRDPEDADNDGWSTCDLDCNDTNSAVYPTAAEIPYNNIDDDCVGGDLRDVDGDGYNSRLVAGGTDCNDNNAAIRPGASEVCNGVDDDCDNVTDENNAIGCSLYYYDSDNDGYGRNTSRCQCGPNAATGYDVTNNTDCYDTNNDARPNQTAYFYADRGDGSWDYNCDGVETKSDTRTTLYECDTWLVPFPPDYGCDWTNGWEISAPDCGDTANWGTSCYYFPLAFCEPNTLTPIDQECR